MSNQEFVEASKKGDLETIQRLLESKRININSKDIRN